MSEDKKTLKDYIYEVFEKNPDLEDESVMKQVEINSNGVWVTNRARVGYVTRLRKGYDRMKEEADTRIKIEIPPELLRDRDNGEEEEEEEERKKKRKKF